MQKSLISEIVAALIRLEQTEPVENAFLRGFRSGAESAYRDVLAMLERNPTTTERNVTLSSMADFQHNATDETFRDIFGNLGNHLWDKFQGYDSNLLRLVGQLDDKNVAALAAYLDSQEGQGDEPRR